MEGIKPPDSFFLLGALGWLELGNPTEARVEFNRVSQEARQLPDCLQIEWGILACEGNWESANALAETMTNAFPNRLFGWVHLAHGRDHSGDLTGAYNILASIVAQFPTEWIVSLNLACYSYRLGELREAALWLKEAFKVGGEKTVRNHLKEMNRTVQLEYPKSKVYANSTPALLTQSYL